MVYEPGTSDCHVFIECKIQIEKMLLRLDKVNNTEHIQDQLEAIYQQIEGMHELKKIQRREKSKDFNETVSNIFPKKQSEKS